MHSVIVGTAGHIDHGKTALVRALTGVDADRLPEEKRRGITIDLGFAELDLGDVRLSFVDVPGHERFVRNMLAGAHGIDLVALVIAADEGVMPQTREHFDICRLLGVQAGLIVITKRDAVDEDLLSLVELEAAELVKGSFLEDAPVLAVSSRTGEGLEELKLALRAAALKVPARSDDFSPRLPVDRAFTMRGFGAVVTGTLVSGEISEGSEMELLPAGKHVRVRGLQVHGKAVEQAVAGQRTAINLGGVETAEIERGMVLAEASRLRPTQIIDAQLYVLDGAPRSLRSRARVRVHLGAAEVLARLRVLDDAGEIEPGQTGFVQLRLEAPVVCVAGERFIIRSYSPQLTIAGGRVLDPHAARARGRMTVNERARLLTLTGEDRAARLIAFVESAAERGMRPAEMLARTGWRATLLEEVLKEAAGGRGAVVEAEGVYLSGRSFEQLAQGTLEEVRSHHEREPLSRGLSRETLRERRFAHLPPEIFRAVLSHLERRGALRSEKELVSDASHSLSLSDEDAALKARLEEIYREAGLEAPALEDALGQASRQKISREHARKILQLLLDAGTLVRVSTELLFHQEALGLLVKKLGRYGDEHEPERLIDVAAFKDLAGVSRKYAIPLLEYLDRQRITQRAGDRRLISRKTA
ncbi:MAG TPA: selenocysteine-specific translation elongation factor [Pyrinomonadaceae bacterium]|nr:selenocysteine-specific translation elongation factor [Pyrinomonadaceae bacterium]